MSGSYVRIVPPPQDSTTFVSCFFMPQIVETFFTAIGCIDGRTQEPIAAFGRKAFGAKYPDIITEAGVVGLLAKKPVDPQLLSSIKHKLTDVSVGRHHSMGVIVYGHQECAGNPVSDVQQKKDILRSAKIVRSLASSSLKVVPVFVKRQDDGWVAEKLQ